MLTIEEIKNIRFAIMKIQDCKDEIDKFVNIALSQFTLSKASQITGLNISKLSRALSGKGFSDQDLMICFLALTSKAK